jgi:fluoride exporter
MKILLAIGTGSFIGGASRYLLSLFIQTRFPSSFPFGTFSVNLIGCFLIGLVFGLSEKGNVSPEWRLFLATGILGGFTTFSAFSLESINLMRSGQLSYAFAYIASSILLGLVATFTGIYLIKLF